MKHIFRFPALLLAALLLATAPAFAQSRISGKVIDSDGQPLAGVTVMVKGTDNGTVTGADGTYSLRASEGDVIEFFCLGLATVDRSWDGRTPLNVTMKEDSIFLEGTVVVGYGTVKKETLTAAVSAIKGEELLKAPATNVSQVLAGKLPGISSVQESGEPGLDQASLRIRGSVYGAAYVVDGFPVDNINDIDPADIESVSVLKDGASAAVYGLKAAGGVIIITTRRGAKGTPTITYNGSMGVSMNANFPRFMNGPQFAYYYNLAQEMDQLASGAIASEAEYEPYFTLANVEAMLNGDPTDGWDNVDYIKKVFGTGRTSKHNITVQGGSENTKYFVSAGYLGQKGNVEGYNFYRYNVRTNIETRLAKNLLFNVGLSGVVSRRETPRFLSGGSDGSESGATYEVGWFSVAHQVIGIHPYLPEMYDGYYTGSIATNQAYPYSPLAALYQSGSKKTNGFTGTLNAGLTWDIPGVKGLQAKVSGSYDWRNTYNKNLDTPYYVMVRRKDADGSWGWTTPMVDVNGSANGVKLGEGAAYSQSITGQASLSYINSFGKHNLEALALAEVRDFQYNNMSAYVRNLPFALLPELDNGTPTAAPVAGGSDASRSAGFVGRIRYNYDEKYLAEFTGRYDGSYKFAGMMNTRWGFFPSASVGWNISKEEFMQGFTTLDNLKLRASVGLLGNDGVSPYMFLSKYAAGGKVVYTGGSGTPSYYTSGIPNKDLTWEKTLSYNAGFDFSLWNGLLGGEIDAFYNYTYDILSYNGGGHPDSMGGYFPTYVNGNAIDSKGIDVLITHRNHFDMGGKPFFYELAGTVTYSKTRWLKYNDNPNIAEWQKVTGTTYGAIDGWLAEGLYRTEEEIDNSAWYGNSRPNIGDIKYVDLNGDGVIDWTGDRGIFGKSNRPELTFGLNVNATWNGFDMNLQFTGGALFQVSMLGNYYNGNDDNTVWTRTFKEGGNSPLFLVENAYSLDNPDGIFPRLTLGNTGHGGHNGLNSSFWWKDGKYVRLKTARLGYTLPQSFTRKFSVEALRIFVEGNNIFTLDGLPEGIDPESPGVNNGYYPQQRNLMGGITITL
ncbi:MAG: TonB-dependent receptor [Bacteroidales bacterium]|nr:TonB-dependent receptor [Bacteroidales bacterium]MBQ7459570.1 TonB-dependent receptor [Bacteroidales bacterium]